MKILRKIYGLLRHHILMKFFAQTIRRNRILRSPEGAPGTEASRILNKIIKIRSFDGKYLEIGIENGLTLEAVCLNDKYGVDPNLMVNKIIKPKGTKLFLKESDIFFDALFESKFDIVYLDGLHTFEQTYRDFKNVIQYLHLNSILMVDDTVPLDEFSSHPIQSESYRLRKKSGKKDNGAWHGDVFKLVCTLNYLNLPELNYRTLVDLQNPKSVVWLKQGFDWPKKLPDLNRKLSESFTYSKYFEPKISEVFHPTTKSKFLEEIRVG